MQRSKFKHFSVQYLYLWSWDSQAPWIEQLLFLHFQEQIKRTLLPWLCNGVTSEGKDTDAILSYLKDENVTSSRKDVNHRCFQTGHSECGETEWRARVYLAPLQIRTKFVYPQENTWSRQRNHKMCIFINYASLKCWDLKYMGNSKK